MSSPEDRYKDESDANVEVLLRLAEQDTSHAQVLQAQLDIAARRAEGINRITAHPVLVGNEELHIAVRHGTNLQFRGDLYLAAILSQIMTGERVIIVHIPFMTAFTIGAIVNRGIYDLFAFAQYLFADALRDFLLKNHGIRVNASFEELMPENATLLSEPIGYQVTIQLSPESPQ